MVYTQSQNIEFLEKLTGIIEANLDNEHFGVSELARAMSMSRSNLHRKVRTVNSTSVSKFIMQMRLKKAMELLKQASLTVSEVAFKCGFHSVSYFTRCFRDHYGFPPGKAEKSKVVEYSSETVRPNVTKPGVRKKRLTIIIFSSALFVIIAFFVLLFIFRPFTSGNVPLDKSIAVLPFINDSPDETEMYFINGTMEAILDNLSKIQDIRVVSRTSVEQYRDNLKPIPEIVKELNVSYVLEGSGLKHGNNIQLTVQLIDAINDRQVWSRSFNTKTEEIFELYSDIAQLVAGEIEARVTPKEKQLIEKTPTTNLTAYDFFQRGRDEHTKYWIYNQDKKTLEKAEELYNKALEYDSTFAQAYTGLAFVCWDRHFMGNIFSEEFLDTLLFLTDIALYYDDKLAEAYILRGYYYRIKGFYSGALKEYGKALKFRPNDWIALIEKGTLYLNIDLVKAIDYFQIAASLNHGPELPYLYYGIVWSYTSAGFLEKAKYFTQEFFKLEGYSREYFCHLGYIEYYLGNFEKAIEFFEKGYKIDSIHKKNLEFLGECYLMDRQYEESLKYFKKWFCEVESRVQENLLKTSWIGYAYWKNGYNEEAEYYFNAVTENCYKAIEYADRWQRFDSYYIIAGVYAFRGDKEKALENLKIFCQKQLITFWWLFYLKNDPLFESIREEPEFQQIVRDAEAKYQTEHDRVRKWLLDNGML